MAEPRELIRRYCRDGDEGAFRDFYRRQSNRLWRYLVARGCDPESAYDLLSESFLRFLRGICRDPAAPVAFLFRIASNLLTDRYRRQKVAQTYAVSQRTEPDAETEDELCAHVRELVFKHLDSDEQKLLLMRYWVGMSHDEIAEALGLPAGTVRRRAAEALNAMRNLLGKDS